MEILSPFDAQQYLEEEYAEELNYAIRDAVAALEGGNFQNTSKGDNEAKRPPAKRKKSVNICATCCKRFDKPYLLRRHEAKHLTEYQFKCTVCSKQFSQKSSLQRHLAHIHSSERKHKCSLCPSTFTQNTHLQTHMENIHPAKMRAEHMQCPHCACVYRQKGALTRHIMACHPQKSALPSAQEDDAPVNDPNTLAEHVLADLRQLQNSMQPQEPTPCKSSNAVDTSEPPSSTAPCPPAPASSVEVETLHSVRVGTLADKLNPQRLANALTVQRVLRGDGLLYMVCEFCSREFRKSYDLIRHRRGHTAERPYGCDQCESSFTTQTHLNNHRKLHVRDDQPGIVSHRHACSVCLKYYTSVRQLEMHRKTHSIVDAYVAHAGQQYRCTYSKLPDATPARLASSQPTAVDDTTAPAFIETQMVPQCHQHRHRNITIEELPKTNDASSIVNKSPHDTKAKTVNCPNCTKSFQKVNDLHRHMTTHTLKRAFVCETCSKSFAHKSTLNEHRVTHTPSNERRQHPCQVCGKLYATRKSCNVHQRLHTGARPFACKHCPSTFRTSGHLIAHKRSAHP